LFSNESLSTPRKIESQFNSIDGGLHESTVAFATLFEQISENQIKSNKGSNMSLNQSRKGSLKETGNILSRKDSGRRISFVSDKKLSKRPSTQPAVHRSSFTLDTDDQVSSSFNFDDFLLSLRKTKQEKKFCKQNNNQVNDFKEKLKKMKFPGISREELLYYIEVSLKINPGI
jgi:hypothetical protein